MVLSMIIWKGLRYHPYLLTLLSEHSHVRITLWLLFLVISFRTGHPLHWIIWTILLKWSVTCSSRMRERCEGWAVVRDVLFWSYHLDSLSSTFCGEAVVRILIWHLYTHTTLVSTTWKVKNGKGATTSCIIWLNGLQCSIHLGHKSRFHKFKTNQPARRLGFSACKVMNKFL